MKELEDSDTINNNNVAKFDNSFWNEEIGNFQGWELIIRRLKDGRHVLKEYAEFLKQRAAIEEQLGKSLVKLAKTIAIRDELEPVRNVWEVVKTQTETSGLAHLKSAHQLFAEMSKVTEVGETVRDKRRMREESVRNHQQNVKAHWKRVSEAKRLYETRCREEVASNQFYHQEVARLGKSSREAEKAHSKYAKARQALDVSESTYQSSVSAVEEARQAWEKETERTLLAFQCMEEERLASVRESLWRVTNMGSLAAVADDLAEEEVRKALEACDLDDAINKFVSNNATGSKRPPTIIFKQQPTSSSLGMGRATTFETDGQQIKPFDTQSLIVGPASPSAANIPSRDRGQTTPPVSYYPVTSQNHASSASLSSLRDINHNPSSHNTNVTMPRGPYYHNNRPFAMESSRSNSQASIATSPDILQTTFNNPNGRSYGMTSTPSAPPIRPRKPPRLLQFAHQAMQPNKSLLSPGATVENTEYFSLPDTEDNGSRTPSSSDYHSDLSTGPGDQHGGCDSGIFSLPNTSSPPRKSLYEKSPAPPPPFSSSLAARSVIGRTSGLGCRMPRKALVVYGYSKKTTTEVTLDKSQVVTILDAKPGSEWWKVQDEFGRAGYYPSHYLRIA